MRVLFAYLGTPGPLYVLDTTPEQALETLPTTPSAKMVPRWPARRSRTGHSAITLGSIALSRSTRSNYAPCRRALSVILALP